MHFCRSASEALPGPLATLLVLAQLANETNAEDESCSDANPKAMSQSGEKAGTAAARKCGAPKTSRCSFAASIAMHSVAPFHCGPVSVCAVRAALAMDFPEWGIAMMSVAASTAKTFSCFLPSFLFPFLLMPGASTSRYAALQAAPADEESEQDETSTGGWSPVRASELAKWLPGHSGPCSTSFQKQTAWPVLPHESRSAAWHLMPLETHKALAVLPRAHPVPAPRSGPIGAKHQFVMVLGWINLSPGADLTLEAEMAWAEYIIYLRSGKGQKFCCQDPHRSLRHWQWQNFITLAVGGRRCVWPSGWKEASGVADHDL
eukprot:1161638-Pelagomonas_calceolata.AAC.9